MSDDKTKIMHKEPKTQRMPPRDEERNPSPPKEGNIKSGTLFYGYEVGERLSANSGEAEIYFAIKNNKKYIIKHYYPKFRPKYEILEKLKGINHPDIINLHEYGNHEGRFYEIMDFAKGGSLSDKTKEGKFKYLPMDEDTVLQVIKETINALKFCHTNGIIHRDIKPGNLFYKNEDGTDILVGDFGISSELDLEGNMSKRMTSTSRTEGYAAPEIYSGVIGKEIDYYALGITIFELLTGINPFAGRNDGHIMRDTIQGRIVEDLITREESKKFSPKIIKLIQGLLTVRHEKRWGYDEVSRFLKGESVPVFQNIIKEIIPLNIADKEYTDLIEIAKAIYKNFEQSKKMLYRGMLARWAENFDSKLALQIGDIAEENNKGATLDHGIYQLIFLLDPSFPYKTEDGVEVTTFEELKNLIIKNNKYVYNDLINSESQLFAWLRQKKYDDFIKIIEKTNKLRLKSKKYNSVLQVAIMTDGFITPLDKSILLKNISLFYKLSITQQSILVEESKDKESPFSTWLDYNLDKNLYDIWYSGKVIQDLKHWNALLDRKLILHEGIYLTEDEKSKSMEREIQITKLEDASKENHLRPIPFSSILVAIFFHIFLLSEVFIFYIKAYELSFLAFVIYFIINAIIIGSKRGEFLQKISFIKLSKTEQNYSEALEFSKLNNINIISVFDLKYLYESKSKVMESDNKNAIDLLSSGGIYWSSTPCGSGLYYGFDFHKGKIVYLHESRKAKVCLCN